MPKLENYICDGCGAAKEGSLPDLVRSGWLAVLIDRDETYFHSLECLEANKQKVENARILEMTKKNMASIREVVVEKLHKQISAIQVKLMGMTPQERRAAELELAPLRAKLLEYEKPSE